MVDGQKQAEILGRFLAWRQTRYDAPASPAVIDAADTLITIAGTLPVVQAHIDQLVGDYRMRCAGPRAIVIAQAVAEDMYLWQDPPEPLPMPPMPGPPSIELDLVGEIELQVPAAMPDSLRQRFHKPGIRSVIPSAPDLPPPPSSHDSVVDQFAPPIPGHPQTDFGPSYPMSPYPASSVAPLANSVPPSTQRSLPPIGPDGTPLTPREDVRPIGIANPFANESRDPTWWDTGLFGIAPNLFRRLVVVLSVLTGCLLFYATGVFGDGEITAVQGLVRSEHLGMQFELDDAWMHAVDFDRDEERDDGWSSRWSLYFRGKGPTNYDDQLIVKIWEREDGRIPSDEEARDIGANEALNGAVGRTCSSEDAGTLCFGVYGRGDSRQFALYEMYFRQGRRIIVIRALYTIEGTKDRDMDRVSDRVKVADPEQAAKTIAVAESIVPYSDD